MKDKQELLTYLVGELALSGNPDALVALIRAQYLFIVDYYDYDDYPWPTDSYWIIPYEYKDERGWDNAIAVWTSTEDTALMLKLKNLNAIPIDCTK